MSDEKKSQETALALPSAAPGVLAITGGSTPMPAPEEFMALTNAAAWIFRSHAFPQYQSAEGVFVGMLYLREMGVNLTMGLSKGFVVHGKFDVEAKVKLASIKSRVPTFEYQFPESSEERCVFRARLMPNEPWTETEYTIARARASGLTVGRSGKEEPEAAWQANRREMLQWRAITRWLNLYAGHVIYTLGGLVARDAMEVQEAVEVVEESAGVAPQAPAPAALTEAVHHDPPPAALPDWKKEWVRLAARQGYATGKGSAPGLLKLANLLMQHLGFKPVRASVELGVVDYQNMVIEMQRRGWDTAVQKDAPAPQESIKGFDEQHADAQVEEPEVERPIGLSAPPPSAAVVEAPKEPEPEPEPESLERTAQSGDVSAIIALGCKLTTVMKSQSDITRMFVQEWAPESGNWWFVDQEILTACGCSTLVEGKQTVNTVLLEAHTEEDKDQEASEALRQMLGAKLVEVQAEFEARTRGPRNVMGARSQAALETSRRGK